MLGRLARGNGFDQIGQDRLEGPDRRRAAQRAIASVAPPLDPLRDGVRIRKTELFQPTRRGGGRRRAAILRDQIAEQFGDRHRCLRHQIDQRRTILQSVQPRDIVQCLAFGKAVRLAIRDHLQPVLDRAQHVIGLAHDTRGVGCDMRGRRQRIERRARAARAKRSIAPAMDQLMRLGEEFDLANAAAPQLQIEARPNLLRPRMAVADARRQPPDFVDGAEI